MKYAIFDFDGTLADSMIMWRSVGKSFLSQQGYPPLKFTKQSSNDTWEHDFLAEVNKQLGLDITYEYFFNWFSEYVKEQYSNVIPLKDTAYNFLETLYNNGVKMCICSSTHREMMQPAIERLNLSRFFEFTCHCNEFGKEKNDSSIFIYCMEKLGACSPAEVCVFEDAFYAANTARNAGFYTVGIYDSTEHKIDQMKEICHQYINNYTQFDFDKVNF